MIRMATLGIAVVFAASTLAAQPPQAQRTTAKWTGWFSDKLCAAPRVANGTIRPNGTACVKKCLADGAPPVFISEQAKALFEVRDHPSVREDVGYHVEVTGVVDEKAGTISIESVKRLSEVVPMCAIPKRTRDKK
jgi:hypothetical protein